MKKFKCLLTAMLLGCSTMSFAQFLNGGGSSSSSSDMEAWKGLRFSYDRTFLNDEEDEWLYDNGKANGFSVGYEQAFKVSKKVPIFIQTGLDLNFVRYKESDEEEDYDESWEDKYTVLGLSIPVNFVYGVKINNVLAIKPYTGFYLRVNLMGKEKYTDNYRGQEESDKWDLFSNDEDDMDGDAWNRVQGGWQIGATFDLKKFNVGVGYALDFNEIAEKLKTSKVMVKLGCNF